MTGRVAGPAAPLHAATDRVSAQPGQATAPPAQTAAPSASIAPLGAGGLLPLDCLPPPMRPGALLALQRTAGNASVLRLLATTFDRGRPADAAFLRFLPADPVGAEPRPVPATGAIAGRVAADPTGTGAGARSGRGLPAVQREPTSEREKIDAALASQDAGDVKSITEVNTATADEKIKLIRILAYQGWVGPRDEYKIEEIWGSFGDQVVPIASTNLILWRHCLDVGAELEKLGPIKNIVTSFKNDVKTIVQGYLKSNEATVLAEMANLGIPENDVVGPAATPEQNDALQEVQAASHLVADLQERRDALRKIPVGWHMNYDAEPGGSIPTVPVEFPLTFNPTVEPNIGPKPGETSAKWSDVKKVHDDLTRQIADIANKFPAVYALIGQGGKNPAGEAATAKPEVARTLIGTAMRDVLKSIRGAGPDLVSDDLDYRDLTPVHAQLFAGEAKGASGTDWTSPLVQSVAKDEVGTHEMNQALIKLGLGTLAAAAFIVAELATFGTATFFIAAAAAGGAAGANVALTADKYLDLAQAAKTNVSDKTTIVTDQQVDTAAVELVMAAADALLIAAGIATKAAAGIKAVRALPQGAKTKLSQPGGLKATEGKQITNAKGKPGPPSHALKEHGPDADLVARLSKPKSPKQASKFTDRAKMETAIGDTIDANQPKIDAWLKKNPPAGANIEPALDHNPKLGNLGEAYRKTAAGGIEKVPGDLQNVRVVLKSDGAGGYVIQTAFPFQ